MKNIQVSEILDRAACLESDSSQDNHNKSYYHFVKYFEDNRQLTEHDLIIFANFTYGWMPTILKFKSEEFNLAASVINKAKELQRISSEQLAILTRIMSNYIVRVSKLLHFINPSIYAIWGNYVCNFLTGKSYAYKVQSTDLFWSYLDLCESVGGPKF